MSAGQSDQELLGAYARGDDSAFTELAERYASMVLGRCRRLLRDEHEAQDAAQAVFMVLARKARSIRKSESLASWLLATAGYVCRAALRSYARRKRLEERAAMVKQEASAGTPAVEFGPELDRALDALPRAERAAIAMHYLSGRTQADVARELGCPEQTARSRIQRGLERLRSRLARRGVALGTAALATSLEATQVAVPEAFMVSLASIGAAGLSGAGAVASGAKAALLAEGATKAMLAVKIKLAAAVLCAAAVVGGGGGALTARTLLADRNPLASLPSRPGPHIAQIQALGENSWLVLGQATSDPKWGVARGRVQGTKMVYAADKRGAFTCGTGVQGYVKPDGHYMDDLWFYDVNAHRWICLYPGANTKTLSLTLNEDGFEVNSRGEHIPVSYLSHAYGNVTYNTHLRKYQIYYVACPWFKKVLPQRFEWLEPRYGNMREDYYGAPKPIVDGKHPLFWDVDSGKWQRRLVRGEGPKYLYRSVLEYIPSRKRTLFLCEGRVWYYDYATNSWTDSGAAKGPPGYCHSNCYDAESELLYVAHSESFHVFDVKGNSWRKIEAPGQPATFKTTLESCLHFDTTARAVVFHGSWGQIHAYDPAEDKWVAPPATAPSMMSLMKRKTSLKHGFYSPELNAHYFYLVGDSRDEPVNMVVYRYKRSSR